MKRVWGWLGWGIGRAIRLAFWSVLAGLFILIASFMLIAASTSQQRTEAISSLQPAPVAIVFGAGITRDGHLSPMLADRVRMASDLYQQGVVGELLMTGDNSRQDYDEVTAMKRYATSLGVPEQAITLDYAGFSTYESCYRAKPIFGVEQAILVTQRFHLPRAVYTCQTLGVQVQGIAAPDWERYRWGSVASYNIRESLANLKALVELHITRPAPTFLGPFEGLDN
ncbi:MAG: ElyC/SanA/YdcF family protein [Roseiflexaceae bacterium]